MLQEDYVTFEQSKLLKEKGFPQLWTDIEHYLYHKNGKLLTLTEWFNECYDPEDYYIVPTLSLVRKWFIDEWNIHIFPNCETDVDRYGNVIDFHYDCTIKDINLGEQICDTYILENFKTPEKALLAGIDKALKIIC